MIALGGFGCTTAIFAAVASGFGGVRCGWVSSAAGLLFRLLCRFALLGGVAVEVVGLWSPLHCGLLCSVVTVCT